MLFNFLSSISTRKSAALTTHALSMQPQPRPAQLPPTPLEQPSNLRGALRTVLQVLHFRYSKSKHPSTITQNPRTIFTSAVPFATTTPSTTASLASLATNSPLFAAQHAGSTMTPAIAFSGPSSTFPSPPTATDIIAARKGKPEREAAYQAQVMHKLDDIVSAGIAKFLGQRDAEAEARILAEGRLAAEIANRKMAEELLLEEQDR